MSKTLAFAVIIVGFATPVLAAPTKAVAPTKGKQLDGGASYVVGRKLAAPTLTPAQIDEVMKAKLGEVTACWHRLPVEQRKKDTSAVLKLEIDDGGEVQTIDVAGIPDDAARCIAKAAIAWTFPETDVKIDAATYKYPIALRAD